MSRSIDMTGGDPDGWTASERDHLDGLMAIIRTHTGTAPVFHPDGSHAHSRVWCLYCRAMVPTGLALKRGWYASMALDEIQAMFDAACRTVQAHAEHCRNRPVVPDDVP